MKRAEKGCKDNPIYDCTRRERLELKRAGRSRSWVWADVSGEFRPLNQRREIILFSRTLTHVS